jgi:NAD(P)-dependent dehydrogenase (short-subunit alcohol dehydrogenase family)
MVTGATAGIGEVTARELARMGATLIGVGRNPEKCQATAQQIKAETGNPDVTFMVADLSSQAEVRRLAEEFKRQYQRLHVLVNNAGAVFNRRQESVDGIEMTMALNHLNYFLVTHLLLDLLKASAPARIVNVSSDAHQPARINFDDIEARTRYSGWTMYGQSKLANVLFTYELSRRLEGTGVTVNALHPGFVATNFGHNNGSLMRMGMKLLQRFAARTPAQGAETSIYLASSPDVEGVTGKYFSDRRAVQSSAASYDQAAARKLWEWSDQMTARAEKSPQRTG